MPGADELAEVTQKRPAKQEQEEPQDRTVNVQKAAWGQFYDQMVDFLAELEAESQRKHSQIAGYRVPEIDDLAMVAGLKALGITSIYEIKKRIGASSDQRHDFASSKRLQAAKEFKRALDEVTSPDVAKWPNRSNDPWRPVL